jgi:hypothetical protein
LNKTKKYINTCWHKVVYIKNSIKTQSVNLHNWCVDNSVYRNVGYEFGTILLNGFFVWLMLFPFIETNPIWYIPSYGIVPWFLINLKQEMFK